MNALQRAFNWAKANRKYTLGGAVLVLVFIALAHPGAKTSTQYSAEVSDAVAHAVDAPAEPRPPADTNWQQYHEKLAKEMATTKDLDLVLYGDSIFESFMGTGMGDPVEQFADSPAVWRKHFGDIKGKIMAISGDTTQNLLWRLQNGELPSDTNTKRAAVLIGSNDLVADQIINQLDDIEESAASISAGVIAVCEQLLDHSPKMKVLLFAIMQRGNKEVEAPAAAPLIPNKFSGVIDNTNERLQQYADGRQQVTLVDCHEVFLTDNPRVKGGRKINEELMPDVLHPNPAGAELMLSQCLVPAVAGKAVNIKPSNS